MTYPTRTLPVAEELEEFIKSSRRPLDGELFEAIWEITVGLSKVHIYDQGRESSLCGSLVDLDSKDWILVRAVEEVVPKVDRCRRCDITRRAQEHRRMAQGAADIKEAARMDRAKEEQDMRTHVIRQRVFAYLKIVGVAAWMDIRENVRGSERALRPVLSDRPFTRVDPTEYGRRSDATVYAIDAEDPLAISMERDQIPHEPAHTSHLSFREWQKLKENQA